DNDGQGDLASLGREGGGQPLVGEQGRVDAPGQVAQRVQGLIGVTLELGEGGLGLVGVPGQENLDQAELDLEGDQVLLGAVVQVAFQAAAFLVLGGDQALAGEPQLLEAGLEVGGQADVLEHQAGLVGEG